MTDMVSLAGYWTYLCWGCAHTDIPHMGGVQYLHSTGITTAESDHCFAPTHPLFHITFHTPTVIQTSAEPAILAFASHKIGPFLDSLARGKILGIFFTPKYAGVSLVMGVPYPPSLSHMPVHPQIWSILGLTCPAVPTYKCPCTSCHGAR